MKKSKKILLILMMMLSVTTLSFAEVDNEGQGHENENESGWVSSDMHSVSESGTLYTIVYTGSDGNPQTTEVSLTDGEKGSGGMQGYGSIGSSYTDSNPMKEGDVIIEPEDIVSVLRQKGEIEAAEAIANGANYDMTAQQTLKVKDPKTGERDWMSMDEINAAIEEEKANGTYLKKGSISYDLYSAVQNSNNAWSDKDEGYDKKGHYKRDDDTPPPPVPPPTDEEPYIPPTYTPTINGSYAYIDTSSYNSSYTASGKISSTNFNVSIGIPTSENVTITAESNLAGSVSGIKKRKYVYSCSVSVPWVIYEYSGDEIIGVADSGTATYNDSKVVGPVTIFENFSYTPVTSITITNEMGISATKGINISHSKNDVQNLYLPTSSPYISTCSSSWEAYGEAYWAVQYLLGQFRAESDSLTVDGQSIDYNGYVTTNGMKSYGLGTKQIPASVRNNTSPGYSSTGTHNIGEPFSVNKVKVHTPIHNTLNVDIKSDIGTASINQYKPSGKTNIITVGDKFKATIDLSGYTLLYGQGFDTSKYVSAKIYCEICNETFNSTLHEHTIPIDTPDNKSYKIKAIVTAQNSRTGDTEQPGETNIPDGQYVMYQEDTIFVVGKIYDLQVRTTDDPGWKLSAAQKLASLAIGEKDDNAIKAYKYGIKLGYRAYFDLKTLGKANQNIKLIPKVYYISKDGNTVTSNIDLYYRERTGYKKLSELDISMKMATTRGELNNTVFKVEQNHALKSTCFAGVNYGTSIKFENLYTLAGFKLTQNNATITQYSGKYYSGHQGNVSRRWYGEIYLPASTVAVPKDTPIANVVNGTATYKSGYLLVVFDSITTNDGNYLDYDVVKNPAGTDISNSTKSQLREEKGTKLDSIKLPTSGIEKVIASLKGEAPIIIYDVSLRANNDYESSGTH